MMHRQGIAQPLLPLGLAVVLLAVSTATRAQAQRDPTVAPASAGQSAASADARAPAADPDPMTVIVRDGRPYLVLGTRLLAPGQKLGEARIERIGETEIWLREGGVLRKIQRYPGVRRVPATPIQP